MARVRGVTIHDVARRAGVSIAAVSMALNDTGTISDATRARVRAVADDMEYQADALARGLRRSSVGAIGVVMRSLDALGDYAPRGVDVFARFIGAVSSTAMDRGLSLMLVPDPTRRPSPPLALSLDGYIIFAPHLDDPVVRMLERRGIPYVTLGRDPSRPEFTDWASEDDATMIPRVLAHFAAAGARSIVLVRGTDPNSWNIDDEQVYRDWCAEHGFRASVYQVPEAEGEQGGLSGS
jgi:Transcriptional regulators